MLESEESFYVSDAEGDVRLVKIYERHDALILEIGDYKVSIDTDGAYEIVDAMTLVLEGMRN